MKSWLKKIGMIAMLSMVMASCNNPPVGPGEQIGGGDCGKCPQGTLCNPKSNKCENICGSASDCGKCSRCENNFCEKFADFCVVSVEPANGAKDVAIETQAMKITFSDDVNSSTVSSDTVGIKKNDGDVINSTLDVQGAVVTVKIGTWLTPATNYTIWVHQDVQSSNFIFLGERYESKFSSISSETNNAGPTGYGLSPVAGQMKGGKYTLDVSGGPVAGSAEGGNKSLTVSEGFWN